ncbi:MAG: Na+/H+ antiporter NhaC family protein [Alkalibacterium sp.]|uniref:Na+/H+ antiporter NhaC family protein n=1 Tax=Alkalibacterium sp. TaxID=1872447 RepID=UPI002648754A|nr:Na+/H+ antiporter NhaC family protein [Alkalibacterium sp.]MDN6293439.1 Na+/H+ antiporter NhaC family protein [Alkalibacterium sp.]MDN6295132.1 Na+/H+ antiporter NhaC family protein [Alkalibacterium sp.]MDN6326912.1 Na+/H+ antiporter NhaC family protein [Alkalibacterium sp.]MDN6397447.1 Na+/H+ antiporter NhaC family protein [Alkalibacterium sp.]
MKKQRKRFNLVLILGGIFSLLPTQVLAAETDSSLVQSMGPLTLIPPIIAIILAFVTKNVILSLFLGIFSGTVIIQYASGANILLGLLYGFTDIVDYILTSLSDPWNAGIILQVLAIGGLIALITSTGGAREIAESLAKRAKGPVSTQIITWALGLLIFFDDYANALIVGPIMRPVSDKMKMSRERLAFVIDATAAPIAGIALISTWIGYEVGLINDAYQSIGQNVNAYGIFLQTIPYRFYNILMLVFVFVTSITLREFGPMKKAQERARDKHELIAKGSQLDNSEDEMEVVTKGKSSIWNALIPIGSLIAFSFIGFYTNGRTAILNGENTALIQIIERAPFSFETLREVFGASDASIVLFQAALIASIIALVMGVLEGHFNFSKGIDIWVNGMKTLMITGVVLLLAWSLSGVMGDLGTADYLVSLLSDSMPAFLLPTVIFLLGAIISFATGTSYGTMGILMPLAIPLATAMHPEDPNFVIMSAGAVLTGAIFGDHASPISDTTILSSMGAGSNLLDHVKTQLPYAIVVAAISILFGYIPSAFGVSVMLVLPLALIAVVGSVFIFGKKTDTTETMLEEEK